MKNTLTVLSRSATASRAPLGEMRKARTSSVSLSVRVWASFRRGVVRCVGVSDILSVNGGGGLSIYTYLRPWDLLLHNLEVPELDVFVCAACREGLPVGVDLQRPDGTLVGLDGVNDRGGGDVEQLHGAGLGADHDDLVAGEKRARKRIPALKRPDAR